MGKPKGTRSTVRGSSSIAVKRKGVYHHPWKKRRVLTTENKLKVLEMIEKGKCRKEVAQQMEYQYLKSKTYLMLKLSFVISLVRVIYMYLQVQNI